MPKRCTRKMGTRKAWRRLEIHAGSWARKLTIEIPVISFVTDSFATAIPPTALVTDTAGVKTPSAIVSL